MLILAQLGQLRSYLQFSFLVLPSHVRGQIFLASRSGVRAQLGQLRSYLQFGFLVLPSHFRGQIFLGSHGMSPFSPGPPMLMVLTR